MLFKVWLALTGLVVGSFLNVVIARVPRGQSIVRPRSRCPKCGHTLSWYENVPLLSWLVLRGRCRGCRAPISVRYPLIELLAALLFLACRERFDWTFELVPALVLVTLLLPLTFIDLEHYLLPHAITWPGIAIGVGLAFPQGWPQVMNAAGGAALGYGVFLLFELVGEKIFKKEALGGGDKYLLALIGAFLGFRPILGVIFLASLQGSVIGVTLLLIHGRAGPELPPRDDLAEGQPPQPGVASLPTGEASSPEDDDWVPAPNNLPFGPYLALAAVELLLLSPFLQRWLPDPLGSIFTGQG